MTTTRSTPTEFVRRHWGVIALVGLAAIVRLDGLSAWWLNPDEGIYFSILTRAEFGGFWQEVTANAHPPLYYLILRAMSWITWDFVWLRLFSVACGLTAVVGAWAVTRAFVDGRRDAEGVESAKAAGPSDLEGRSGIDRETGVAGLVAGLLLTLAPSAVELSQVMRPYMLQLALLTWATWFLIRYERAARTSDLGGYIALLTLALLTHYSSALALGVFGLASLAQTALARGPERRVWGRLALAHALPIAVLIGLYLTHLGPLSSTALADDALDGWLSFYMIEGPADVWWSFLGFQHLLVGRWLWGPMALVLLVAIAWAARTGDRTIALLSGGALLFAVAAAAAGVYPFGSTRHSAWALAFTVPAIGYLMGQLVRAPIDGWRRRGLVAAVLLGVFGGPVGTALGVQHAPWAPADRVLQRADMARMVDLVDPEGTPRVVLMSEQTFYLLMPFFTIDRETAVPTSDGEHLRFAYGQREVLVRRSWDFTLDPEPADGAFGSSIEVASQFANEQLMVLVGGWRPLFLDQLRGHPDASSFLISERGVPGLWSFRIDPTAARTALAASP